MKVGCFIIFFAAIISSVKAQDCDVATTGVAIVNAANTASVGFISEGQNANFKFSIANFGTEPGCTIPANSVTVTFNIPTINGNIKPYIYDGLPVFVSGYFTWTYNNSTEVLTGINTTAIPNGEGDVSILVKVKGNISGTASSTLIITQENSTPDNPGNNSASAQLIIVAAASLPVSVICPGATASFTAAALPGSTYQWQVDAGSGFVNINNDAINSGANTNTLTLVNAPTSWYGRRYQCFISGGSGLSYTNPVTLKFVLSWQGTTDNNWGNSSNWNCPSLPDGNTDVILNTGSTRYPQVNSNVSCRSLTVQPGATIEVKPGYNLTITGKN